MKGCHACTGRLSRVPTGMTADPAAIILVIQLTKGHQVDACKILARRKDVLHSLNNL